MGLVAGNAVVLKPSSLTPLTAFELASTACGAGLPQGLLGVVWSDNVRRSGSWAMKSASSRKLGRIAQEATEMQALLLSV